MPSSNGVGRRQGLVTDWNDARGFGFIRPMTGGPRVFVHASAFRRGQRPVIGCEVTYAEVRDERGRARAGAVQYLTAPSTIRLRRDGMPLVLSVVALFFTVLLGLVVSATMPVTMLAAYGLLSGVTFLVYGADKAAAELHAWRTSESALHTFALLGGWPGALLARRHFRHKTRKQPFVTIFWITVIANCLALAWFVYEMPVRLP